MEIPFTRIFIVKDDYVPRKVCLWVVIAKLDFAEVTNKKKKTYQDFRNTENIYVGELDYYSHEPLPEKVLIVIDRCPDESPELIACISQAVSQFSGSFEVISTQSFVMLIEDPVFITDLNAHTQKEKIHIWLHR